MKLRILMLLLLGFFCSANLSALDKDADPVSLVESITGQIFADVTENLEAYTADPLLLEELVRRDLMPLLDIDYSEDSSADVDFNVVMTDQHVFVEIQGTAEKSPFTPATLDELLVLASTGLDNLFEAQKKALARL